MSLTPTPLVVKICGVRDLSGARACAEARADLAGLNFAPGSRRRVTVEQARALLGALGDARPVGVFQDQPLDELLAVAEALGLTWLQLHGQEPPQLCAVLSRRASVIKALTASEALDPHLPARYAPHVAAFLVDGRQPGSGTAWGWAQVAGLGGALAGRPLWLAGGLSPDNVADAIAQARPAGVDVASGAEEAGAQSPARIARFCALARAAAGGES